MLLELYNRLFIRGTQTCLGRLCSQTQGMSNVQAQFVTFLHTGFYYGQNKRKRGTVVVCKTLKKNPVSTKDTGQCCGTISDSSVQLKSVAVTKHYFYL